MVVQMCFSTLWLVSHSLAPLRVYPARYGSLIYATSCACACRHDSPPSESPESEGEGEMDFSRLRLTVGLVDRFSFMITCHAWIRDDVC